MACAALTVNVYPEATRYDFQILDAPVAGVPPHPFKDLLSIGHKSMVPNTAPLNNVGQVLCQASGLLSNYNGRRRPPLPVMANGWRRRLVSQCRADGLNLRFTAATMPLKETLAAAWKYCLSFRKTTWELSDYPVVIREQKMDLDLGLDLPRFEQQRYLARVVKWWVLNGGGNTPKEVMQDLAVHFEEIGRVANAPGSRYLVRERQCPSSLPLLNRWTPISD